APAGQQCTGGATMGGLQNFLLRGHLLNLAVAVVIGLAFAAVVTALVKDLITPLIAAIGGKPDFSNLTFTVNHSKFFYGDFINALIAFLVIAAVVYFFVVIPVTKLRETSAKPETATEKECPECLSKIPLAAHRCMYCTSVVAPAAGPTETP